MDLEYFKKELREVKLGITPQRLAIYKAVMDTSLHPNTEADLSLFEKEWSSVVYAISVKKALNIKK